MRRHLTWSCIDAHLNSTINVYAKRQTIIVYGLKLKMDHTGNTCRDRRHPLAECGASDLCFLQQPAVALADSTALQEIAERLLRGDAEALRRASIRAPQLRRHKPSRREWSQMCTPIGRRHVTFTTICSGAQHCSTLLPQAHHSRNIAGQVQAHI